VADRDALLRRYLAQQIELGGTEAVLPAMTGAAGAARGARGAAGDAGSLGAPGAEEADVAKAKRGAASRAKAKGDGTAGSEAAPNAAARDEKWRKGAPPIPGSGLTITSPDETLLGNDLRHLRSLDAVAERIRSTYCCDLCPRRTNAVPGEGNPKAKLVLVGEGPGATEDQTGRPFVGQAGQLLDSILEAIGIRRADVFITNIVKCRPPQNRKPLPDEMAACIPYLHRQLELIRPKVILALGGTAAEGLLGTKKSLGELRNRVHTYNGVPLVVTYHPAALLRNPNWKKPTWDDVRIARQLLDR
jgi:DNA polymerase